MTYTYDGDGNRVEKSSGKIYWYGAGTEILDESDLSGNISNEYVFFGAKRITMRVVSSGTIYYYEDDMLGSARTMVQAGATSVCYDGDFYPFGGERIITNTCSQNYKFEGKERDTETGNDDFGARYYTSRLGRWLSADWSSVPAPVPYANLTNPQTLNLYAMASDNPETFADLDGHCPNSADSCNIPDSPNPADSGKHVCNTETEKCDGQKNAQKNVNGHDQDKAQQQTLNLGGTKVDVTSSAYANSDGMKGVTTEAYPQGCDNCRWAQTVTRTGDPTEATHTDREGPSGAQPLYPPSDRVNGFSDTPGSRNAGTFRAVTTLGVANGKSFKVAGSMTWGYRINKNGSVTAFRPRVATRAEQAHSIAVLKRDSPMWTIIP